MAMVLPHSTEVQTGSVMYGAVRTPGDPSTSAFHVQTLWPVGKDSKSGCRVTGTITPSMVTLSRMYLEVHYCTLLRLSSYTENHSCGSMKTE